MPVELLWPAIQSSDRNKNLPPQLRILRCDGYICEELGYQEKDRPGFNVANSRNYLYARRFFFDRLNHQLTVNKQGILRAMQVHGVDYLKFSHAFILELEFFEKEPLVHQRYAHAYPKICLFYNGQTQELIDFFLRAASGEDLAYTEKFDRFVDCVMQKNRIDSPKKLKEFMEKISDCADVSEVEQKFLAEFGCGDVEQINVSLVDSPSLKRALCSVYDFLIYLNSSSEEKGQLLESQELEQSDSAKGQVCTSVKEAVNRFIKNFGALSSKTADKLSIDELLEKINQEQQKLGKKNKIIFKAAESSYFKPQLQIICNNLIKSMLLPLGDNYSFLFKKMLDLNDIKHDSFAEINQTEKKLRPVVRLIHALVRNDTTHDKLLVDIWKALDFSNIASDSLTALLELLKMPSRKCASLLQVLLADNKFPDSSVLTILKDAYPKINKDNWLMSDMIKFTSGLLTCDSDDLAQFNEVIIELYSSLKQYPSLREAWFGLLPDNQQALNHQQFLLLSQIVNHWFVGPPLLLGEGDAIELKSQHHINCLNSFMNKDIKVIKKFTDAIKIKLKSIDTSSTKKMDRLVKLLFLLVQDAKASADNLEEILTLLLQQDDSTLAQILTTTQYSPISLKALQGVLESKPKNHATLGTLLYQLEIAPHGQRFPKEHCDITEAWRVVNELTDLSTEKPLPFVERQQLFSALLWINAASYEYNVFEGQNLEGKIVKLPASKLSNADLKANFQKIKQALVREKDANNAYQLRLLAITLVRESLYRTHGIYAYSTQILAILSFITREKDTIGNIDTGQGKNLLGVFLAALLWCEDATVIRFTHAQAFAERDLALFSSFYHALGIELNPKVVTATSAVADYKLGAINYTVPSQYALFLSRQMVKGKPLHNDSSNAVCALFDEVDKNWDDLTAFRLGEQATGSNDAWVYTTVNLFIDSDAFTGNINRAVADDILSLRNLLEQHAPDNQRNTLFVNQLSDLQLYTWLQSALVAKYLLTENIDYVIKEEQRQVDDQEKTYKTAVLLIDNRPSLAKFGNGVQQLLHARLNMTANKAPKKVKQRNNSYYSKSKESYKKEMAEYLKVSEDDVLKFVIEPETPCQLSTNFDNLMTFFQSRPGVVYGLTGTAGSNREIKALENDYGFTFFKVPPHQVNQTNKHTPKRVKSFDEAAIQVASIIKSNNKSHPILIFCRDIPQMERYRNYLVNDSSLSSVEIINYDATNSIEEEHVLANSLRPGCVVLATPALGRAFDAKVGDEGLLEIQTFIASTRDKLQMDGRAGRQGQKGEVYYVFNSEDDKNSQGENTQDALLAQKRRHTNSLNRVRYFLFQQLAEKGKIPAEINRWAKFSDFMEKRWSHYSQQYSNYSEAVNQFSNDCISDFKAEFAVSEINDEALNLSSLSFESDEVPVEQTAKSSILASVNLADCLPPQFFYNKSQHLFTAVTENPVNEEEFVDTDDIKNIKQELIKRFEQYLANSWFVSSDRKSRVELLLKNLNSENSLSGLANVLQQAQIDAFNDDLAHESASIFPRQRNRTGSRFQNTILDAVTDLPSLKLAMIDCTKDYMKKMKQILAAKASEQGASDLFSYAAGSSSVNFPPPTSKATDNQAPPEVINYYTAKSSLKSISGSFSTILQHFEAFLARTTAKSELKKGLSTKRYKKGGQSK